MAGAGLDSRAVAAVDWEWKKRVGPLAYIKAGLEAMRGAQPLVIARGNDWEANGELVLIGNGRFYGGRVPIFPMASMDDGALDVRVFPRVNMLSLARFGWAWLVERPLSQRGDRFFRADRVTLASTSPVPFELDGDNAGMLPATLTVRRSALRAIVAC
jgi:diacylglycerol kinase family enzyme